MLPSKELSNSLDMPAAAQSRQSDSPENVRRPALVDRLRILYVTTRPRTGGWLAEALVEEYEGEFAIVEAIGIAAGLAKLQEERFDVLLVCHLPGELDAFELIYGYRTGGFEEPIVVLGAEDETEMAPAVSQAGADEFICVQNATARHLIWIVERAICKRKMAEENRRLHSAERTRLRRETVEADQMLRQQRSLIGDLETLRDASDERDPRQDPALPDELWTLYRQLLRAYVIMGSGNMSDELKRLADLLVATGASARQAMRLHLSVLEEMVRGLGSRSSRHVMTRADLLAMELMIHLTENYRLRGVQTPKSASR